MPLAAPPLDENGEVQPHDHEEILDGHGVLRRISPYHMVKDEKHPDGQRVSSMAFQPSTGENAGMSIDLEESIRDAGLDPKIFVVSPPFIGAVRFTAGYIRSLQLMVGYEPLASNPHHGEVWGTFSTGVKKQLCSNAEPFVLPAAT